MNEFQATTVIVALFALRCVVPFLLLLAIGYGMKRLAARWEREEATQALEVIQTKIPCWVFNNCDEKKRAACPAYLNSSLACWAARAQAEGQPPAGCANCSFYRAQTGVARLKPG
jgi:hypothetical protein